ncbi:hypothetical protein [Gluconacetobacter tumulisoli]|uniref:hypothetical protein n=1 Tax=Gluconacetobacter tumulisoli TaxID=1286189 RepID=UPI001601D65F|nr:hypothetical protein [Gluconacetobacter tumulisoli]
MSHDDTLLPPTPEAACYHLLPAVAHPSDATGRIAMQNDYDGPGMTALAVASTMIWTCGMAALVTIRRHVARCLEDGLIDDAEFWLKVRNQAEILLKMEQDYGGTRH